MSWYKFGRFLFRNALHVIVYHFKSNLCNHHVECSTHIVRLKSDITGIAQIPIAARVISWARIEDCELNACRRNIRKTV